MFSLPKSEPKLTARQQEILDLIKNAIERTGAPPTRAEIAGTLGFRSANAAEEHLQALARKGVIDLISGTSRGIRLRGDALRSINESRNKHFGLASTSQGTSGLVSSGLVSSGSGLTNLGAGLAQLLLPLVGRVAAGSPILAQEHVQRTYAVEPTMFTAKPDYLLQVRGMSMQGVGILDGDLLAVQTCKDARDGQIVVARLGEEVTVKRLRRTATHIELLAENPDFKTIVVHPGEPFELEGLAVGLIRNSFGSTFGGNYSM